LRRPDYAVTIDRAFVAVMRACAAPRSRDDGTWITDEMVDAYTALHRAGIAHSLEVWQGELLTGGIYGVALGRAFFGESMFSRMTDGSKVAITWLAAQLARWDVPFIDCQLPSDHLASLGAILVTRQEFVHHLAALVAAPAPSWRLDPTLTGAGVVEAFRRQNGDG
jgi:leucyl/phenylalanyl-tRNA--protein transferase